MIKNKTAIVILSYADYESLEISLACHSKFLDKESKIFILQNGRGTYDCERTYEVGKRYETLFPKNIEVIDDIPPQRPYHALKQLFKSKRMNKYDYICKLDDDVFPITEGWFDHLCATYDKQKALYGNKLGYITSLINNNPWGTKRVMDILGLYDEYKQKYSRDHYVGMDNEYVPKKFIPKGEFNDGGAGTIWKLAYISRWIHNETTLQPDKFIAATKNKGVTEVNNKERYSINCMVFDKNFWDRIDIANDDDEHQAMLYCLNNDKKIIADMEVPMIHLFFYPQRNENKDIIKPIRDYYQKWLDLIFPISICEDKNIEIERRLRFLETGLIGIRRNIDIASFNTLSNKLKYLKYRILSELTTGKIKKHYKEKKFKFKYRLGR